jgi:hypothetical protein
MIWYYLILFLTSLLSAVFSWLPKVTTLPTILGVDIDTQLAQGVGAFYTVANVIWPIKDVYYGALVLLGYYAMKMVLRFFLGGRAPQ